MDREKSEGDEKMQDYTTKDDVEGKVNSKNITEDDMSEEHLDRARRREENYEGKNSDTDETSNDLENSEESKNEVTRLSESVFIYQNRKISDHGNVFEGEVRSGVYGVRVCAIKFARKSEQNVRESSILTKLGSHTHVISIIQSGIYKDMLNERVYIALDKCHEHNLHQHILHQKESGVEFNLAEALEYSKQIIAGVMYVHEKLIIHKDLKPSNILLSHDKSTIKIADFGLSQEIKSTSSKVYSKHQFGTNGFRPIESFGNDWVSLKSDIYSLGVVFYSILSNGKSPFGDEISLWTHNVQNGVVDLSHFLVPNVSTFQHLIKLMLSNERCRRPSIWQLADHPCWGGNEVECNIDNGFEKEIDDSDAKAPEERRQDSSDSESDMDSLCQLFRELQKMGYDVDLANKESPKNIRVAETPLSRLHKEIEEFYEYMSPTEEEQRMREYVIKQVEEVVLDLWEHAKVDVFGSFKTGLYLPTSDIDMVVFCEWDELPLWTLRRRLIQKGIAEESTAKVFAWKDAPILKLRHLEMDVGVIISFNFQEGIRSVTLIKEYISEYPALRKLVFVLKQFLLQRDLNEVLTGGIGSYSLILLCVSFLQLHPRNEGRLPNANLGLLLIEFFELYSRYFNFMNTGVRVRDGGSYIRKEEVESESTTSILCIEDPLTPGNNVGKGSYGALQVKQAFEYAYRILHSAVLASNYRRDHTHSTLSRILKITHKAIKYRKEMQKKWSRRTSNRNVAQVHRPFSSSSGRSSGSEGDAASDEQTIESSLLSSETCSTDSDVDEGNPSSSTKTNVVDTQRSSLETRITQPKDEDASSSDSSIGNKMAESNLNSKNIERASTPTDL